MRVPLLLPLCCIVNLVCCQEVWGAGYARFALDPDAAPKSEHSKKHSAQCWSGQLASLSPKPVLSYVDGSSDFQQVFNPAWVQASEGTGGRHGLLIRTQNCSGCKCCTCSGFGENASRLTFAELLTPDGANDAELRFAHVSTNSVVFSPEVAIENLGVEDPRIVYDDEEKVYHMFYTCFSSVSPLERRVRLCHAYTSDPTHANNWKRKGAIFTSGTKSAAVLHRGAFGEHLMFWGEGTIRVTKSSNLHKFDQRLSTIFMEQTMWGASLVEPGPPPLRLSTGDYVFFINSWDKSFPKAPGYQPGWLVLNGSNPLQILAQASEPLWSPSIAPWMTGDLPYGCNAKNVAFVSAAHPTETPDTFRLYFGGADAVVGTAVVKFSRLASVRCTPQIVISAQTMSRKEHSLRADSQQPNSTHKFSPAPSVPTLHHAHREHPRKGKFGKYRSRRRKMMRSEG